MNLAVDTPWILSGLLLALLPLLFSGSRETAHPYLQLLPADPVSRLIALFIRLVGCAAIALLVLAVAGLHRGQQSAERIGRGAHIVLLLDRSRSMDNNFAGRAPNGHEESKSDAARRLLTAFVNQREHDLIGVAAYSTSPLYVMPLTENKPAVQAAIAATATPGLAYTHISKGLAMALSFFEQQPLTTGERIILLVSDGAAVIDPASERKLRQWFTKHRVRLYWVFLRTAGSPGIYAVPEDARDDNAQAMPERYLHLFFSSLDIPYQAYQAEDAGALQQAIDDINRLENRPFHYFERIPRLDFTRYCYAGAALSLILLLLVKVSEIRWST